MKDLSDSLFAVHLVTSLECYVTLSVIMRAPCSNILEKQVL